ncbi:MAG: hypothetical protein WB764_03240 [Xanthobacteraceae bacterium]
MAASSVRLSASGVEMSGFGAPALTAMPTPELARVTALPAAILSCFCKASMPARLSTTTSAVSPPSMRLTSIGAVPQVTASVWLALSNCVKSCSAALRTPMVLKMTSSAMRGGILLAYRYIAWE